MSDAADSICFYCSQVFVLDGRFNRTPDGVPCPICADRLMDSLPPLIPAWDREAEERERESAEGDPERDEASAPVRLRAVEDRPEPA